MKVYMFEKQRWTSGSKWKSFWCWGFKNTLQERIIFVKFWNCLFETKSSIFKLPNNYRHPSKSLWNATCKAQFLKAIVELTLCKYVWLPNKNKCKIFLFFFWVLDEFKVDIMFALLASSTFFPHLSAPYVSFLTQMTLSAVHTSSVTNVFTFTISLLCFSHIYTQTHTHTPLVGISATLLTGANQSYNTFIISTPPQVPSCWVKSHLGLFECFTALEICNYIMDMGGPGLAGSSHWQLDTKQTRCEQNSTPQKKKKKKNKMKKRTKTTVYDQRLAVVMLHSFLGPSLFNLHKLQNGKLACGSKRSHFKLGGKAVEFQGFQKNKWWSFQTRIVV